MIPPSSCHDFIYAVKKISDYSADPYSTKKAFVSTHHSTGCSRPRLKSRGDFQRHICRDILPSHACRAPSSGWAKTRWKYQPSTETWMHHGDFETRVCMQWDGTVDAWCVLKETDTGGKRKITDFSQNKWSRKKISYRFYKWKLGTSLGQTISEWNTWPIARDKMTDSALLDQTWKHKKGKHKQDKLREMKYIY